MTHISPDNAAIKRHADGSIDTKFYMNKGRMARSESFMKMITGLFHKKAAYAASQSDVNKNIQNVSLHVSS